MKCLYKIIIFLFVVLFFVVCLWKKNIFLSRNYYVVIVEYNVIYNGDVVLVEGKEELVLIYWDNFWEILFVECIEFKEEFIKLGE